MVGVRRKMRVVAIGAVGFGAGVLLMYTFVRPGDHGPEIRRALAYGKLGGEGPFVPQPGAVVTAKNAHSPARFLVWNQASYSGPVEQERVRMVIMQSARGEALEHRLNQDWTERFRRYIGAFDRSLEELSILVHDEGVAVKESLRDRPDRTIRLTRPREKDRKHKLLNAARREIEQAKLGVVWGDIEGAGREEVHFKIYWREWPELKALIDEQHRMIAQRRQKVRSWIKSHYEKHGWAMFKKRSD